MIIIYYKCKVIDIEEYAVFFRLNDEILEEFFYTCPYFEENDDMKPDDYLL